MINISEIVQSSGWKNFMAKLYGLGAMVVIIGALFKIQHWPGAGMMLTVGLSTEAVIFFFSAFEPIHEEVDWTLVYPELAGMTDEEEITKYKNHNSKGSVSQSNYAGSDAALAKFDQMIEQAEITPDLFKNLGSGLQKLSENTSKMNEITDATAATNEYVANMRAASQSIGQFTQSYEQGKAGLGSSLENLSSSYNNAAQMISRSGDEIANQIKGSAGKIGSSYEQLSSAMNASVESIMSENKNYGQHLESLNKNMAALNAVYELQLQGQNDYLRANNEIHDGFGKIAHNLKESVEETEKYKSEISALQKNLAALNNIYGNMLSAMTVGNNIQKNS